MQKKAEKTNYDYLKEFLKGNDEGLEFLEAMVKQDNDRTEELQSQINGYEIKIDELESEIEEFNEQEVCDNYIDFGFGKLHYKEPDNNKLHSFMEGFKERQETNANFGQLKLAV